MEDTQHLLTEEPSQFDTYGTVNAEMTEEEIIRLLPTQKSKRGCTFTLAFACTVIAISSFQNGYSTGVINTPYKVITKCEPTPGFFQPCVPMDELLWGVAVSIFTIGGLIGSASGGYIMEIFGRRAFLWFANFFLIAGSLLQALFSHWGFFVAGRFIVGMGSGAASTGVPTFVCEIAPDHLRGALGTLHELAITIGIFISQFLAIAMNNSPGWRFLLGIPIIPSLFQILMLPLCPESPRWQLSKGKDKDAKKSMSRLTSAENVEEEIQLLKKGIEAEQQNTKSTSIFAVFRKSLWKTHLIGIGLQIIQHFGGLNVVIYYSTNIFTEAKVPRPDIWTAAISIISVVITFVSFFLLDRVGRRPLLLISEIIMIVFFGALTASFIFKTPSNEIYMHILSIASTAFYLVGFSIGLGSIPSLMLPEIYPNDVRSIAAGLCSAVNWLAQFVVSLTFPIIQKHLGEYMLLPYIASILISILFTIALVPETKGKSIEEITSGNLKR